MKSAKLTFCDQPFLAKNSEIEVSDQNIHKFLAWKEETGGEEPKMKVHEKDKASCGQEDEDSNTKTDCKNKAILLVVAQ